MHLPALAGLIGVSGLRGFLHPMAKHVTVSLTWKQRETHSAKKGEIDGICRIWLLLPHSEDDVDASFCRRGGTAASAVLPCSSSPRRPTLIRPRDKRRKRCENQTSLTCLRHLEHDFGNVNERLAGVTDRPSTIAEG